MIENIKYSFKSQESAEVHNNQLVFDKTTSVLRLNSPQDLVIPNFNSVKLKLGITFNIPIIEEKSIILEVFTSSKLLKKNLVIVPIIINNSNKEEIEVHICNHSNSYIHINKGDHIIDILPLYNMSIIDLKK